VIIKKLPVKLNGSCNFCDKGFVSKTGKWLQFPYSYIYSVTGEESGSNVRFCEDF